MSALAETMAIIRNPKFGVGDRGSVTLTFDTYTSECSAALQVFGATDGARIISEYGVSDVSKLEGQPCWVDCSSPGLTLWARSWKGNR